MIKTWKERMPVRLTNKQHACLEYVTMCYMLEEISELREENKNLLRANLDCIDNFNSLKEDYDKMQKVLNEYVNPYGR